MLVKGEQTERAMQAQGIYKEQAKSFYDDDIIVDVCMQESWQCSTNEEW